MAKTSEITRVYFSHDNDARDDNKILRMFYTFRKIAKDMTREELESFVSVGSYGIFWSVVEYMHRNTFKTSDIELLADDLRIDTKFVEMVLDDFELFRQEGDCYVSDRITRNVIKQKENSEKKREAANVRWIMSFYDKAYKTEFGITPVLDKDEKKKLLEYADKIENFKEILPDILFTLKNVKFEGNVTYNPRSNWLLKDNNLARLLHGEFGKLKHKERKKELKESKKPDEYEIEINSICNKIDAISFISSKTTLPLNGRQWLISPPLKELMKKFDISEKELLEYKEREDG